MSLLATLITTYTRDSNPYVALESFHEIALRQARSLSGSSGDSSAAGQSRPQPGPSSGPENSSDLGVVNCSDCRRPVSDCRCITCERCDTSYDPEGLSDCECSSCGVCDEPYYEERECECCHSCERRECDCCHMCGGIAEDCSCCRECERTDRRCTRCRECDRHDGEHETGCAEAPQEVSSESSN